MNESIEQLLKQADNRLLELARQNAELRRSLQGLLAASERLTEELSDSTSIVSGKRRSDFVSRFVCMQANHAAVTGAQVAAKTTLANCPEL